MKAAEHADHYPPIGPACHPHFKSPDIRRFFHVSVAAVYNVWMSRRRMIARHLAIHFAGIALLGGLVWTLNFGEMTAGVVIVVIAAIAAVSWAVIGTLRWMVQLLVRWAHGE